MPRYRYLLIALAVFATSWSAFKMWPAADVSSHSETRPRVSKTEFEKLEKMATLACDCTINGGDSAKCYSSYETAKAKYEPSEGATACAPISTSMDCFLLNGEEGCIVTGYSINGIPEGGNLCRRKDAQAIDQAYSSAFDKVDLDNQESLTAAHQAGQNAMRKVLKRINAGERVAAVKNSEGCV